MASGKQAVDTLIKQVCATNVLNLPPYSGLEKPKSIPCSGKKNVNHIYCSGVTTPSLKQNYVLYCIVLYCIVLYCIVLYCIGDKDTLTLYLFNQMILPFHFSSTMFVQMLDLRGRYSIDNTKL